MNSTRRRLVVVLFLSLLPLLQVAQRLTDPTSKLDEKRRLRGNAKVARLSRAITAGKEGDAEKVTAIYRWVTRHIRYDKRSYRLHRFKPAEPWYVLRRRKAVCAGYATLFKSLCANVGIESNLVIGHAKGLDYREGERFLRGEHAWNAVLVNGEWQLLDATWGSTTAIPRKQFIRKLAFKLLGIPYLQKLKIVHRPNMDWLAVSPDDMVMSHLPIDPKWQLRDSAVSIAEFEAVRDTFIPAIPNEFLIAIAATRGQIEPIQEWVEGKNGKQFNARDDFDLARGWIRKGHEALLLPPEAGGDTITWLRGISDMKESTPALAAWMKELATENRLRGRELALLSNLVRRSLAKVQTDVNRVRAEHRRMEHFVNVIDYQQANEQRLLQKMRTSFSGIGRGPAGIPKPPKPRVMENLRAKYETSLYRADSLTGLAMKTTVQMLSLSDTIERLQDSLQDSRGNATTQLNICLRRLMQGWEVRYGWGLMRLDSIGDRLQGQSKQWQKAKNRYWTVYKASRVKWLSPARQLERAHGLICQMHRSGAPVQMLMGLRDSFQLQFDTFRKLRIEQMQIPLSEGGLQLGHLVQSEAIYGKTDRDIRRQNKFAGKYIAQERRRQANWHRGEQALASHLRHSARIGAGRLGGWVNKARAEAKRALASRK